ncbi:hypothetical protein [Dactylosporangium sp. NPDC049140]|jgi:hypothetical protein|uniref:hypothetical protein n=1 Tax=Dactylosporangium sp. NPDC049140 TaxID=3155647 RepID=UPI0033E52AE3
MTFEVPDACTLPTAEQPLRLAEFDALFTSAVRDVEAVSATHARMWLTGPPGLESMVRDLAAREAACCSFFTFTITPQPATDGDVLVLDIEVSAAYTDVLTVLAGRATAATAA